MSRPTNRGELVTLVKQVRKTETLSDAVDLVAEALVDSAITSHRERDADAAALDAIAATMNGTEWDADTLDGIARIVRATGRTVADVD